tara:strand:+ start:2653 stop:2874 length:222 start_codon:yes stop_codon:yes gene_type:complete
MKYNIIRKLMSNYSDFPRIDQKPIMREEDLRTILRNLNTIITDIQSVKSDIAEIKQYIKERDQERDISKGWWY